VLLRKAFEISCHEKAKLNATCKNACITIVSLLFIHDNITIETWRIIQHRNNGTGGIPSLSQGISPVCQVAIQNGKLG
jgi:hypothetical protein